MTSPPSQVEQAFRPARHGRPNGLLYICLATLVAVSGFSRTPVAQQPRVTFSETIAPIVYSNCVTCHRPGEAAPFSLISYEDVAKRAPLIAKVTASRYMPPWHAAHGFGDFVDERRLTDEQIALIAQWVKDGVPEGDPAKMPPAPQFTEGWHLGTPDLVLQMPESFEVPANGPDIYRNFVIPAPLTEDKWVRAVEFRPSARRAVHHAIFFYIKGGSAAAIDGADGQPGFAGIAPVGFFPTFAPAGPVGGWAVGATPSFMADGESLPLPKGSDLVVQMHFHPTGKPETERATLGLYFADRPAERRLVSVQVPALFGFGSGIDIPAGDASYVVEDSFTVPVDVRVYAAAAHAHYLGKEMKATATLPDGTVTPLLWIQQWDFNWQDRYMYKAPVALPKGTRIDVRLVYDNSADNPKNPSDPPKRVTWGEQSFDEMGAVSFEMTAVQKEDERTLQQAFARRMRAAVQQGLADGTLQRYLRDQALRGQRRPAERPRQ